MIEIVTEFRPFLLFAAYDGRDQMGVLPQIIAHFRQQRRVFGKTLHQNIARAIKGRFGVRHAVVSVDVFCRFRFRGVGRVCPQQVGQRFKSGFDGDLPACATLGFVGQVEVFEFGLT